jgi:hypothetical protein
MTVGGVAVVFVTVTVPSAFVTTRIGATTRALAATRFVDVDEPVGAVVDDAVVDMDGVVVDVVDDVVAAFVVCVTRRLPSGGLAARVGLALTEDVSVGVRMVVLAPVATEVVVGPAAN